MCIRDSTYSIANGIIDKNVLGFDPYMCPTYKDKALRRCVALEKAKAQTAEEDVYKRQVWKHRECHVPSPQALLRTFSAKP